MDQKRLKNIVEGVLLAAGKPLSLDQMLKLFDDFERPERDTLKSAIADLQEDLQDRGIELKKVASGYRLQVRPSLSLWVSRLWDDKPARYSRAFLETMALIAFRQPITRGEIEAVRGVAVSSNIIRTMIERDWVKVVGHRDVPGKPALFATTRTFLDSFNLNSLSDLPSLAEIRDLDAVNAEIDFENGSKHTDPGLHEDPQTDLLNVPQDSHTSALLQAAGDELEEEDSPFSNLPDFTGSVIAAPVSMNVPEFANVDSDIGSEQAASQAIDEEEEESEFISAPVNVHSEPAFDNN